MFAARRSATCSSASAIFALSICKDYSDSTGS
jgi:hypothetical protein